MSACDDSSSHQSVANMHHCACAKNFHWNAQATVQEVHIRSGSSGCMRAGSNSATDHIDIGTGSQTRNSHGSFTSSVDGFGACSPRNSRQPRASNGGFRNASRDAHHGLVREGEIVIRCTGSSAGLGSGRKFVAGEAGTEAIGFDEEQQHYVGGANSHAGSPEANDSTFLYSGQVSWQAALDSAFQDSSVRHVNPQPGPSDTSQGEGILTQTIPHQVEIL